MTGWIIYSKDDFGKNSGFVEMFRDRFAEYEIELETIIIEELEKNSQEGYCLNKEELPDFAINRSRNATISRQLENCGIRVFNSAEVTEICNNKGKNYEYLKGVVPFLPVKYNGKIIISDIVKNNMNVDSVMPEKLEYPYVIKSCAGHGGSQVFMVNNRDEEKQALEKLKDIPYLIQQCCSDLGKDVRIYIIGNEIVAAVLRTSKDSFKSNYSLGGKVEPYTLNNSEVDMVKSIIEKLPLDYAGIDFTFHNGKAVFNEIEDAVGARMLYQVSDLDIVQIYVQYIVNQLQDGQKVTKLQD